MWRAPVRVLANPGIYAGVLLAALLVVLAYQSRPSYGVQIGSKTDAPFLDGLYSRETLADARALPFRWTSGYSLVTFQDVGRQDFDVTLTMIGERPAGTAAPRVRITVGMQTVAELEPSPELKDYTFHVPRDALASGTLRLELHTNSFRIGKDTRDLGVILLNVRVAPGAAPDLVVAPPLDVLAWVIGAVALVGLVLSLLGWGAGVVGAGAALVALLAGLLLTFDRLWLTTGRWYTEWSRAIVAATVLVGLAALVGGALLRWGGVKWSPLERRVLLTILFFAYAAKLAGQLHPEIYIVDLNFHAHRLGFVETGQLLFQAGSSEFGGQNAYYLPTTYVFMWPLDLILHDSWLVVRLVSVALNTLGVVLLFYIAKRILGSGRAGILSAGLYVTLPMSVLPLSWGISTNLFGEFFALCAFALLVGAGASLRPSRPFFWVLATVLTIALLGHQAVVALFVVALVSVGALWGLFRRRLGESRSWMWTLGAFVLSGVTAFALYYHNAVGQLLASLSNFASQEASSGSQGGFSRLTGGSVSDKSLGLVIRQATNLRDWIVWGLQGFWQEAVAYYKVWPLAGAALGFSAAWPGRGVMGHARARLVLTAAGWTLSAVVFALIGWIVNLYARYSLFALPVVALGGGVLLSRIWARGNAGRYLCILLLVFFAVTAIAFWQYRINYALK